jgi:hypothetical protein
MRFRWNDNSSSFVHVKILVFLSDADRDTKGIGDNPRFPHVRWARNLSSH